jgi:hypothetical protein
MPGGTLFYLFREKTDITETKECNRSCFQKFVLTSLGVKQYDCFLNPNKEMLMMKFFTAESVKLCGEDLGFCPIKKGHLYSICLGPNNRGRLQYKIVYVNSGIVHQLIDYTVN